jgi:hypothetical protein
VKKERIKGLNLVFCALLGLFLGALQPLLTLLLPLEIFGSLIVQPDRSRIIGRVYRKASSEADFVTP